MMSPEIKMADGLANVAVSLGDRSYTISIGPGLTSKVGAKIKSLRPRARVAIVTDENVAAAQGAGLVDSLGAAGIEHTVITVPPGEATKRFEMVGHVVDRLLDARIERGDLVLAHGGGVVGDLTGFAAGILRRGVGFVQMPTTLLSQVDSSVGGKTGVNARQGKNLIGVFHQPVAVFADTTALETLPEREFLAGYAEVAKIGLLGDASFMGWLDQHRASIFAGGEDRTEAIARACAAKAGIVQRDETEQGERALLNLGHTFGHGLEAVTGYSSRLLHGEGVAIGMAMAFRYSVRKGLCPQDEAQRAIAHLQATGLPTAVAQIPGPALLARDIMTAIRQDKKVQRGALTFILARGIGQAFIARDVDPTDVEEFIAAEISA
jgi:3-dehydroquinate synthase